MVKWYHVRAGIAWMIGALIALIGLLGAAVAATAQITLTRSQADSIYETKEHAAVVYQRMEEQHERTLELILEQLKTMNKEKGNAR